MVSGCVYSPTFKHLELTFSGPEVTGISSEVPKGCVVDMAAFFSRHGSRYPDQDHIQKAKFSVTSPELEFLRTWRPALSNPSAQIAQISPTGYKELAEMGATWRLRYSQLYEYNTPFDMWSNWYNSSPRVRDSARMFAHGFLGPNATELGTIYALNSSDPSSWMNSLAPSDLCPAYKDQGGSPHIDQWQSIYLPPIVSRLNAKIVGNFSFTQQEVSIIPYLCGFETQILGRRSPFCDIFTEEEILHYEYAQDLRYWYGTGLGTDIEKFQMVPTIEMLVKRFVDGPDTAYNVKNSTFHAPNIMASFSNDGQINQLIAASGVFDNEPQLPSNRTLPGRKFRASRLTPMRGTIAFERLICSAPESVSNPPAESTSTPSSSNTSNNTNEYTTSPVPSSQSLPASDTVSGYNAGTVHSTIPSYATASGDLGATNKRDLEKNTTDSSAVFVRILLNDVVYPVPSCSDGPGASCSLLAYRDIIRGKLQKAGSFTDMCKATNATFSGEPRSTFFMDNTLSFAHIIKP